MTGDILVLFLAPSSAMSSRSRLSVGMSVVWCVVAGGRLCPVVCRADDLFVQQDLSFSSEPGL